MTRSSSSAKKTVDGLKPQTPKIQNKQNLGYLVIPKMLYFLRSHHPTSLIPKVDTDSAAFSAPRASPPRSFRVAPDPVPPAKRSAAEGWQGETGGGGPFEGFWCFFEGVLGFV